MKTVLFISLIFGLSFIHLSSSEIKTNELKFEENPMESFMPKNVFYRIKTSVIRHDDQDVMLLPWDETKYKVLCNNRPVCKRNLMDDKLRCTGYCSQCVVYWQPKRIISDKTDRLTHYIRRKHCKSCFISFLCDIEDWECQNKKLRCSP